MTFDVVIQEVRGELARAEAEGDRAVEALSAAGDRLDGVTDVLARLAGDLESLAGNATAPLQTTGPRGPETGPRDAA